MAHEPKKRQSKARQGKRRQAISLQLKHLTKCTNCNSVITSHTVCSTCGYYKGKKVLTS